MWFIWSQQISNIADTQDCGKTAGLRPGCISDIVWQKILQGQYLYVSLIIQPIDQIQLLLNVTSSLLDLPDERLKPTGISTR